MDNENTHNEILFSSREKKMKIQNGRTLNRVCCRSRETYVYVPPHLHFPAPDLQTREYITWSIHRNSESTKKPTGTEWESLLHTGLSSWGHHSEKCLSVCSRGCSFTRGDPSRKGIGAETRTNWTSAASPERSECS